MTPEVFTMYENPDHDPMHSQDRKPRFVEVTAEDGTTVIYHREDRSQWIQSDVAVDRATVR